MSSYKIDRAAFRQAMQFLGIPTAGLVGITSTPSEIRATYQVRGRDGLLNVVGEAGFSPTYEPVQILHAEAVFKVSGSDIYVGGPE